MDEGFNQNNFKPKEEEIKTKENKLNKSYVGKTTINGVEIIVEWDNDYDDYVVFFPQIDAGKVEGVFDKLIRITRRPEVAKQIFEYTSELAKTEKDVYKIYKQVEDFSRGLPYDEDEE